MTRARVKDVTFVLCSRAGGSAMSDWVPPAPARVEGYFKELNNWGRWGDGDQLGTVNLVTPAKRARAQTLVKTGRTVSLARDIGPQPALMYHATFPSNRERADVVLDRFDLVYHGFTITHIDALCHVAFDGQLYNGRPFMQSLSAAGASWCPIDPLFDGITTRGVLLDVAAGRKEGYVTVGDPITPRELDGGASRLGAAHLAASWAPHLVPGVVPRARHSRHRLGHDGRAPERLPGLRHGHPPRDPVPRPGPR